MLCRDCITWIENGAVGNGSEHGHTLQDHLGGAIFINRYLAVGPNTVDLRDGSNPDLIKCLGQKGSAGANKSNGPTWVVHPRATFTLLCSARKYSLKHSGCFFLNISEKGGVLSATVQHKDSMICMAQLGQSQTTCFLSIYLVPDFVSRWKGRLYVRDVGLKQVSNRRFWFKMTVGLYLALN